MQLGVLITNGGKHSDEKLAIAVASDIVQVGADATGQQALDGRKLENQIIEIMESKFRALADFEHAQIDELGTEHLAAAMHVHPEILESAVMEIRHAIVLSPFASWFTSDQVASYVRTSVTRYLQTAQHMHRDWFAAHGKIGHGTDLVDAPNHNPDCPHVQRWKAMAAGDIQAIHEHAVALASATV